jgi:S-DNA-T family DNA segregation ATPase FtsK/SpoIIIE
VKSVHLRRALICLALVFFCCIGAAPLGAKGWIHLERGSLFEWIAAVGVFPLYRLGGSAADALPFALVGLSIALQRHPSSRARFIWTNRWLFTMVLLPPFLSLAGVVVGRGPDVGGRYGALTLEYLEQMFGRSAGVTIGFLAIVAVGCALWTSWKHFTGAVRWCGALCARLLSELGNGTLRLATEPGTSARNTKAPPAKKRAPPKTRAEPTFPSAFGAQGMVGFPQPSASAAPPAQPATPTQAVTSANPWFVLHGRACTLPPLLRLDPPERPGSTPMEADDARTADLEAALAAYGADSEVVDVHQGPVVTTYEVVPAPGVRSAKIEGLDGDIARTLGTASVRVVPSLPGRGALGIEVPSPDRRIVSFREVMEHAAFRDDAMALPLALGVDVFGTPVAVDLATMPHLLVAGATNSGKSVGLNAVICSLLFAKAPDEARLILVDPKCLELEAYKDIPNLMVPVITDAVRASSALRWAVDEMDRRYAQMATLGAKDVRSYNRKVDDRRKADPTSELSRLPYLVIVIDELADLMMVAAKDVETSIMRLAQKARAAAIHLILATQRPSVDVLTGLIKANLPARVCFQVASSHDSRVVIDSPGAEKLLGAGDMLLLERGKKTRVHGAYVSEQEVERIASWLRKQGRPIYDETILGPRS